MYAFRNSGLTKEQLTNFGVTGKDVPLASQSPLFPALIAKPIEIEKTKVSLEFCTVWRDEFRAHLYDIHSNSEINLKDDSYSTRVANALEKEHKRKLQFKFAWSQMPLELKPMGKRKINQTTKPAKKVRAISKEVVEQKLEILEQKESQQREDDETSVKAANESDEEADVEEDEDKMDQEMDDDIDYGNNYFDNGEGYNEEDDNLDDGDGPVY